MTELIEAVVAMSWPLLVVGALAGRRWAGISLAILITMVIIGGTMLGALAPMDVLHLPAWTGLGGAMLSLVLWCLLGALARAAGGVSVPGPPILSAMVAGALIGEIAAAGMVAGLSDRRAAARLALAASGGALIGRMGDPGLVLMFDRVGWSLAPLGLLIALVALPGTPLPRMEGRPVVSGAAALIAVAAVLSGPHLPVVLGVGCVMMAALAGAQIREIDLRPVGWIFGLCVLVLLATTAGLPELAALGLETIHETLGGLLLPAVAGIGALAAVLGEGASAALLGSAIFDRALDLSVEGVPAALVAGLAVGGLSPLIVAGALREGLLRWAVQVILAIAWAGLVL